MSDITNYLQSIEDRIDAINTCELLQEASDEIKAELNKLLADLKAQMTSLTAQTTPPVDLVTTIAWITAQIDAVKNSIAAMIEETTLIMTKVAEIMAKLENKISTLGCSFTPPSIP
jgi:phage-related protein